MAKPRKPHATSKSAVHRTLHLTSPQTRGTDIESLQRGINKELTHRKLEWHRINVDAELGQRTTHAAYVEADVIGLSGRRKKAIKSGKITEPVQAILRDPSKRSRQDRIREKLRKPRFQKARDGHNSGPPIVVSWCQQHIGTTESPPSSNLGPGITQWEIDTGYAPPPGVYWCGCFACEAVVIVGGAKIPVPSRMGYGPNIIADAQAGNNGFHAVHPEDAQAGDVVVYWGGEHIGVVVGPSSSGLMHTIEGNTSSDTGSQNNGGGVYEKHRPFSDVTIVARPTY